MSATHRHAKPEVQHDAVSCHTPLHCSDLAQCSRLMLNTTGRAGGTLRCCTVNAYFQPQFMPGTTACATPCHLVGPNSGRRCCKQLPQHICTCCGCTSPSTHDIHFLCYVRTSPLIHISPTEALVAFHASAWHCRWCCLHSFLRSFLCSYHHSSASFGLSPNGTL